MSDVNLSAVLHKIGDLRLEDRPIPEPQRGEVQIAVHSVGICGSDVHFLTHGAIGDFVVDCPLLLGHESSGTVTKLGDGVTNLKVGDRVAVEPAVPCRKCTLCKTGRYNLCPDIQGLGVPPCHGDLARYHVHAADFCYKLPDSVSFDEGALLEPLSVVIHACRRARVTVGHNVLICGAGTIGLLSVMTAKAMGAGNVVILDIIGSRLELGKRLGADYTLTVDPTSQPHANADDIVCLIGCQPDVTLECTGAESCLQTAVYATASGGVVMLVGFGPAEVRVPVVNAAVREVDIRGVLRYANCYPTALSMVASGAVDVKPLVTHHFKLEQCLEAFEVARTAADGAIKVMIECSKYQQSTSTFKMQFAYTYNFKFFGRSLFVNILLLD